MLVVQKLRGQWRLMTDKLKPYFWHAMAMLQRMRRRGVRIDIVHIYRENSKDADAKANLELMALLLITSGDAYSGICLYTLLV